MVRVFTNYTEDLSSIPGRVITKTQKLYLMPLCLTHTIKRYGTKQSDGEVPVIQEF